MKRVEPQSHGEHRESTEKKNEQDTRFALQDTPLTGLQDEIYPYPAGGD